MMEDIEAGYVNCVIVKDLSRLGRDYIEVGRLLQKTFPAFFVRFLALVDQFDSLTADVQEKFWMLPMKNFMNDAYARDISVKVRSHQQMKREQGEFIGAFAVYGYKKSEYRKNLLVPDRYAAMVVQKIFAWKLEGYSHLAIAKRLNRMGILSPMEYKKMQGEKYQTGFMTKSFALWSSVAVKRILENEMYTGTLVQGKEERINYKIKKSVQKKKELWTRVSEAHEAIISKSTYDMVQELMQVDICGCGDKVTAHTYAGLLFCGDCGKQMVRRVYKNQKKEKVFFICSTKNQKGMCSRHTVSEQNLTDIVWTAVKKIVLLFWKYPVIKQQVCFHEWIEQELKQMKKRQEQYHFLLTEWREKGQRELTKEDGKILEIIYQNRYQQLKQMFYRQMNSKTELLCTELTQEVCMQWMEALMLCAKPDRAAIVFFISRVVVYENQRIVLKFRFRECD